MKKILFFLTALFCSVSAWASIDVLNFTSPDQEKEYQQLTQELRCPQCQNNNIADSNATIAVDMRAKVFELLQEGKSKQQVVNYMVQRYGNFVTYDPPLTAATIMLWVLPLLLVLFGIALVLRRRTKIQNAIQNQEQNVSVEQMESLTDAEQQRLQELLKDKE
jgi:putative cytochrome c-type biogenesis protein ccmH